MSSPAEHLVRLPGTDWALWRAVAVRAAGFPVAPLLGLANPRSTAAADEVLAAEEELDWTRSQAVTALADASDGREGESLRVLRRLRRRIKRGAAAADLPADLDASARADLEAYHDAREELFAARTALVSALEDDRQASRDALRELAADPRFQEAVVWQNRHGYQTGLRRWLRGARKTSQAEQLVVRYAQRYCAKNDTIGFFGPLAWAEWSVAEDALTMRVGDRLVRDRQVGFEGWGLDRLAAIWTRRGDLRSRLAPRRHPAVRLTGTSCRRGAEPPRGLTAEQAAVLAACDGRRSARELAAELKKTADPDAAGRLEATLGELAEQGLVTWSLEPPLGLHPERPLRRQLEACGDTEAARTALTELDELEAARARVAQAAGDPEALDGALEALEATFTRLAGGSARRAAGQTYAGRTLVYEDCRRDAEIELGGALLGELARLLEPVLASGRWLTFHLGEAYRGAFAELHRRLAAESGDPTVELADFWPRAQGLFFGRERPLEAVLERYRERWRDLLGARPDPRRLEISADRLLPRARAAFQVPAAGWTGAVHHSPDLMIAARDVAAIREGRYRLVLGELHTAVNTLNSGVFAGNHPRPETLAEALAWDVAAPRLLVEMPRDFPRATTRTHPLLLAPHDHLLLTAADAPRLGGSRAVPLADLVVVREGAELRLRRRGGGLPDLELLDAFSFTLATLAAVETRLLPRWSHTPRVTVDRLVLVRESWRVPAGELEWAGLRDEGERLLALRRWLRQRGLPRFTFVRVPTEIKPVYVDFDSRLFVDNLARLVRGTLAAKGREASVSLVEMLPTPDETWLPDEQGRSCTSELRLVAVDLEARAADARQNALARGAQPRRGSR